jgi:sterol desaturase/sphingolipid hydroxylase (fatty acid hydroxylase superfamily)
VFWCVFLLVALWEYRSPKRDLQIQKSTRWVRNLSLIIISNLAVRLLVPITAASVAVYAEQYKIGLWYLLSIPLPAATIISIILLDLLIYAQHILFHYAPLFWRIHKIHHIDQDIDVTTGLRFHPLEIILSALIKCMFVLLLRVPLMAIILFEILLNAMSMFSHANISLPKRFDKYLRLFIVTPDMHRVHHSVLQDETNSNFGFNLSCWDHLFRTHKAQPKLGHLQMNIGLDEFQDKNKTTLLDIIMIPFRNKNK